MELLIVGAGPMARAHGLAAKARSDLTVTGLCRSTSSAEAFTGATGIACGSGGLAALVETAERPTHAIVAVPVETLLEVTLGLIEMGVRRILVEKPAGLDASELTALADRAAAGRADVHVAYNRRFYPSVERAKAIIEEDGGPTSLRFDFTERSDLVAVGALSPEVKRNWVLANSSHVIDLAFFLAGDPIELDARIAGSLPWHPDASRFVGSGTTDRGAAFSYHADWDAPGRWSVDVRTRRRRLLLEPMEELKVQMVGSFAVDSLEIEKDPDGLKPGVSRQLEAFLDDTRRGSLVTIAEQARRVERIYDPIAKGRPIR